MSSHHCHANDCPVATSPKLLMCARHWRLVPKTMQGQVWATLKTRSAAPGANPESWAAYYEACAHAVEYVAALEGKPTKNSYRRMVPRFREHAANMVAASSQALTSN
jgi:hypothetical protein